MKDPEKSEWGKKQDHKPGLQEILTCLGISFEESHEIQSQKEEDPGELVIFKDTQYDSSMFSHQKLHFEQRMEEGRVDREEGNTP